MLTPCAECGKNISDQAKRCPHCGFNLTYHQISQYSRPKKILLAVSIVAAIIIITLVLGGILEKI